MELRQLDHDDIPSLMRLNDALNWTFTRADFETVFAGGLMVGYVADEAIVASAAAFPIGESAASVGAVMVAPDFRRRGLGSALMRHLHEHPRFSEAQFRLVSTDEGLPLYEALGYRTVTRLNKMLRPMPWPRETGKTAVRDVRPEDLAEVVSLDAEAVGGARADLIAARLRQAYSAKVLVSEKGQVSGFAIGAEQRGQLLCGPVVAKGAVDAVALLHALSHQYQGQIRVDIADDNVPLLELLRQEGFQRETHPPVMVRGRETPLWGARFNAPMAQMFG